MTDDPRGEPAVERDPDTVRDADYLTRARDAIRTADRYGDLTPDERLQLAVSGASAGKIQAAYLRHASTLAIVSAAESLATLIDVAWTAGLDMPPRPRPANLANPAPNLYETHARALADAIRAYVTGPEADQGALAETLGDALDAFDDFEADILDPGPEADR